LSIVAKWLQVAIPEQAKPISEFDKLILDLPKSSLQEFEILPHFNAVKKRIIDLSFPHSAFIIMIKRNGKYIRPGGSTEIESYDTLMVIADSQEDFIKFKECLNRANTTIKT